MLTTTRKINPNLTLEQCWKLCNNIQHASSPADMRERCAIAEEWLTANTVISNSDYDEMMVYVSALYRESYEWEREV